MLPFLQEVDSSFGIQQQVSNVTCNHHNYHNIVKLSCYHYHDQNHHYNHDYHQKYTAADHQCYRLHAIGSLGEILANEIAMRGADKDGRIISVLLIEGLALIPIVRLSCQNNCEDTESESGKLESESESEEL